MRRSPCEVYGEQPPMQLSACCSAAHPHDHHALHPLFQWRCQARMKLTCRSAACFRFSVINMHIFFYSQQVICDICILYVHIFLLYCINIDGQLAYRVQVGDVARVDGFVGHNGTIDYGTGKMVNMTPAGDAGTVSGSPPTRFVSWLSLISGGPFFSVPEYSCSQVFRKSAHHLEDRSFRLLKLC